MKSVAGLDLECSIALTELHANASKRHEVSLHRFR